MILETAILLGVGALAVGLIVIQYRNKYKQKTECSGCEQCREKPKE